jgi:hypothetical protein
MGDLITTASYSEITNLVEVLDHQGVTPHDLEVLRKSSSWSQQIVGRVHRTDRFLWAMLGMEQSLGNAGFCEDDFRCLAQNPYKLEQILKIVREGVMVEVPDSIIRVNRSVKPVYPDWVKELLHPELEGTGPTEYDITKVEQWLHNDQKGGKWLNGQKIYEHLKENNMLESCLDLADLLAIQAKGIAFFREHFADKGMFGWKSVVRYPGDGLGAPCLYVYGGKVVLNWRWLEVGWYGYYPALRFAR